MLGSQCHSSLTLGRPSPLKSRVSPAKVTSWNKKTDRFLPAATAGTAATAATVVVEPPLGRAAVSMEFDGSWVRPVVHWPPGTAQGRPPPPPPSPEPPGEPEATLSPSAERDGSIAAHRAMDSELDHCPPEDMGSRMSPEGQDSENKESASQWRVTLRRVPSAAAIDSGVSRGGVERAQSRELLTRLEHERRRIRGSAFIDAGQSADVLSGDLNWLERDFELFLREASVTGTPVEDGPLPGVVCAAGDGAGGGGGVGGGVGHVAPGGDPDSSDTSPMFPLQDAGKNVGLYSSPSSLCLPAFSLSFLWVKAFKLE